MVPRAGAFVASAAVLVARFEGGVPATVAGVTRAGTIEDGLAAGAVAAVLSGAPSTLHALATRTSPLEATLAGLGIAALDLAVVGRRHPRIRALPVLPQVADHVAYGVTVGAVLRARRR